jgi:hypothetical protein
MSLFVTAHGEINIHRVPFGVDVDALLPGQPHLYRKSGQVRAQRRVMLHAHVFLAPEPSTDQHAVAVDLLAGSFSIRDISRCSS